MLEIHGLKTLFHGPSFYCILQFYCIFFHNQTEKWWWTYLKKKQNQKEKKKYKKLVRLLMYFGKLVRILFFNILKHMRNNTCIIYDLYFYTWNIKEMFKWGRLRILLKTVQNVYMYLETCSYSSYSSKVILANIMQIQKYYGPYTFLP